MIETQGGTHPIPLTRAAQIWQLITLAGAALSLGGVAGWLTGLSGPDSTVLASLLPAVVPAVGVAAIYVVKLMNIPKLGLVGGIGIIIFCGAVVLGIHVGTAQRYENIKDATVVALQQREPLLELCSKLEQRINAARESLKLSPLPIEYFCKL